MTTFYISPSSLSYKQYADIHLAAISFGWVAHWLWARESFRPDVLFKKNTHDKALRALARSDIFIACLPGTCSTYIEIGAAYTLCEEMFIVAKDPVHFTQTGLNDAHISCLQNIKRVCCDFQEITTVLKQEYLYLVETL